MKGKNRAKIGTGAQISKVPQRNRIQPDMVKGEVILRVGKDGIEKVRS